MSLPAQQYAAMRTMLRDALSINYPLAPNPGESEVLGFINQLFADASGAAALPAEQQAACVEACRQRLSGNFAGISNPSNDDVVAFFAQLQSDASGATALPAFQYRGMRIALHRLLASNPAGTVNPTNADVLRYFASFGGADPTTLAGSAALVTTGRVDREITLGGTMLRTTGAAGVVTLTGNLVQAVGIYIIFRYPGGTVGGGVATFDLSLDAGASFVETAVPLTSTHAVPGTGITLNFAAATYALGTVFRATVAQIVDYKTGFVFANATITQQPVLDYLSGRWCLKFDGLDDRLDCTTAGVNAWVQGDDLAYTILQVTRYTGVVNNNAGALLASSTTTSAKLTFGSSTPQTWLATKAGDDGVIVNAGGGGGGTPVVANTTYVAECSSTGTAVTVTANGSATTITALGQNSATATTLDKLSIGGGNTGSNPYWVFEWACYSGNQRAVLQPVLDYMTARYADIPSGAITDAFYFDTATNSGNGAAPVTQAPNDYKIHPQFYPNVRGTIALGVTSISISAIPYFNGTFGVRGKIGVYLDGVITPYAILDFGSAPMGGKTTQTVALDGAAHTVRIDCDAALYSVTGVTLTAKSAPNTRVLGLGDSITYTFQAIGVDLPFSGWAEIVRASLDQSVYGFTNFGVQGIALNNYAVNGGTVTATVATVQALMDGTSKNILVIALGTNDYAGVAGSTAATFQTQLDNLVVALNVAMPSLIVLLFSPTNRNVETANGGGSTLPQYRTSMQTVATNHPTYCHYLDGNGIITVPGDLNADPHPNSTGYGKIAAAVLPAIQAL